MNKKNQRKISTRFAKFGTVLSITFFILSGVSLFNSIQGEWLWVILLSLSLVSGLFTSFAWPSTRRNGRYLIAASIIAALQLLIAFDMQDEAINIYPGGLSVGNGFLLDGIAMLAYIGVAPLLFLVYIVFLVINMTKKVNSQ